MWWPEALAGADFTFRSCLAARLSRRVGGVPRALVVSPSVPQGCCGWSASRDGLQAGSCGGDVVSPWPALGEAEPQAAAAAGEAAGDREQAQPHALGFPAAGGGPGEGEQ